MSYTRPELEILGFSIITIFTIYCLKFITILFKVYSHGRRMKSVRIKMELKDKQLSIFVLVRHLALTCQGCRYVVQKWDYFSSFEGVAHVYKRFGNALFIKEGSLHNSKFKDLETTELSKDVSISSNLLYLGIPTFTAQSKVFNYLYAVFVFHLFPS